jgi:uncharacterized protein (DUF362 family)
MRISRRDFIKLGVSAAFSALLPRSLFSSEPEMVTKPVISVARGDKAKLVRAALDTIGGIDHFIKPGDRVCIKPNISFAANIDCGATTSPEITRQVVELCLDAGASQIVIVDHTIADPELCVVNSRIKEAIVDNKKVSLVTLNNERLYTEVEVPDGTELSSVLLARVVQSSDKLINLPTAKSHSGTGVSLGMKNFMGLVWDRGYLHQRNLHRAIADLGKVIKPHINIVDATRVLTSGGPGGPGKTALLNTVIAGTDVVAVDSYTVTIAKWYGKSFTGSNVKYINAASSMGIGEIDINKMTIKVVDV